MAVEVIQAVEKITSKEVWALGGFALALITLAGLIYGPKIKELVKDFVRKGNTVIGAINDPLGIKKK